MSGIAHKCDRVFLHAAGLHELQWNRSSLALKSDHKRRQNCCSFVTGTESLVDASHEFVCRQ